jgi:hypothetical protein
MFRLGEYDPRTGNMSRPQQIQGRNLGIRRTGIRGKEGDCKRGNQGEWFRPFESRIDTNKDILKIKCCEEPLKVGVFTDAWGRSKVWGHTT